MWLTANRSGSKRRVLHGSVVVLGVLLVGCALLTTTAAADDATLDRMAGNGTEQDPYVITDVHELQAMEQNLTAHYTLANDIDASETELWEGGSGFDPIGDRDELEPFVGSLDGNGHAITDLKIDRPSQDGVGLLGYSEGSIEDLRLENVDVSGNGRVGAVVGHNDIDEDDGRTGTVRNISVDGDVYGTDRRVGGIIGENSGSGSELSFIGDVEGTEYYVGGLIGWNNGPVSESYATGTVDGSSTVGGLVGTNNGPVRASFFTGDVTGERTVGGLAGSNEDAFNDAYALAHIESEYHAGGLFGSHSGTVTGAYAAGSVTSEYDSGGLISENDGIVNDAYWDVNTTGQRQPFAVDDDEDEFADDDRIDVTGLDSDELTGENPVDTTELDFDSPWKTTDEYPRFQWEDARDVSDAAYEISIEPVELEEESEEEAESENAPDDDQDRDADEVLGVPGFGVMPAALALLAIGTLIGYRKRS